MKVKFAVLGDAFVDVVASALAADQLPQWGSDIECSRPIQLQPGGSALNTATHLANLNSRNTDHELHVALHTVIGTSWNAHERWGRAAKHREWGFTWTYTL